MKNKIKKLSRPKAINPKGFRDYQDVEISNRNAMLNSISEIYFKYGFDALETPSIETVEALGKFLPEVDRPNQGIFSWLDEEDNWLALRYDLTAPLARFYSQFKNQLSLPYRRFSMGPVWRNEKPGPGRFKQFYQCDADSVGVPYVTADAEICMMLSDILESIGIAPGDYIIKINNRKILDSILDTIGLNRNNVNEDLITQRGIVLRAIDKLDRLGLAGVQNLLGEGREDASGDFSKGAGLSKGQTELILEFLKSSGGSNQKTCANLKNVVKDSAIGLEGLNELEHMCELVSASGFNDEKIQIDPTVVRGLGYYTGPVFEAELTFKFIDEKGNDKQFGSVAGGGRYDDLIKRFTGQTVPATGVSIGVDRLLAALKMKKQIDEKECGPIVVTVMDKSLISYYQSIVQDLRKNGFRSEMFLGNPKDFGKQLKYADQRNSPIAVIVGSEEVDRGVIQLKNLELGAELSKEIESNREWKERRAQVEINRSDLIREVRKMLSGDIKKN